MKIPFHRFELILVIIPLILITSGCIENQVSEPENGQQYAEELGDLVSLITFDEGLNILQRSFSEDMASSNGTLTIYYTRGEGVNQEGKAKQWIFGTVVKNDYYFVIVESDRQTLVPYYMGFFDKVIDTNRIILPDAVIAGNKQLIMDAFGKNERFPLINIELMDDTYTVTASTGSVDRILRFDVFNGNPINP